MKKINTCFRREGGAASFNLPSPPPQKVILPNRNGLKTAVFTAFLAAVFGIALSGCDFIDGLLGKGNDNDTPAVPEPLATGGQVTIEDDWEIHVFPKGEHTLAFSDTSVESVEADYLIVAGGGGAGGDHTSAGSADRAGGGGAGGLLYQTGQTLLLNEGAVQITVGTGGAAGAKQTQGSNGGSSAIGNIAIPGGGGGGGSTENKNGNAGGSGGGSGAGTASTAGAAGSSTKTGEIKGNKGGISVSDRGGGGGGASSEGANGSTDGGGAGGNPWMADNEASWIANVTGTHEFSRGGTGGDVNGPSSDKHGVNYGDGGSASNKKEPAGGDGHDGIVVIRFKRTAGTPPEQGADG
jgi:hypothetical protein